MERLLICAVVTVLPYIQLRPVPSQLLGVGLGLIGFVVVWGTKSQITGCTTTVAFPGGAWYATPVALLAPGRDPRETLDRELPLPLTVPSPPTPLFLPLIASILPPPALPLAVSILAPTALPLAPSPFPNTPRPATGVAATPARFFPAARGALFFAAAGTGADDSEPDDADIGIDSFGRARTVDACVAGTTSEPGNDPALVVSSSSLWSARSRGSLPDRTGVRTPSTSGFRTFSAFPPPFASFITTIFVFPGAGVAAATLRNAKG
ncbi:hypothetical protein BDK51DRAFT_48674 [Blyttiomyces helicus]|uniref:Uncharacterized protein n=1 Tax=Blyttiomyces helicus TaxID=388810 RepID=A0A4P9VYI6_9FUNG|nr:hypothetical protein BDK51DRAFT_48674 [Blyttiomyces helicus]|eukprot:RKO84814.1 hypothetical protein BDK51DRAFT_48674 [Blyttiomyces helicus]